jgi:TonB-dependent SusC/RagA subfamily outer membrane receptor
MKRLLLLIAVAAVMLSPLALHAQDRTVSGVVTSVEDGTPLPGVNVVLQGTTEGTSTDADGRYTMTVPSSESVLVFSFIGLASREVEVGNRSVVDVQMEADVTQLTEVVVVGYGTTTQQAFTGTAKVVDADDLIRKKVTNVSRALAGEVAGVQVINTSGQPGEEATIRIRGFGSVNGNRDPLYVVDGVPFAGSLNSINPSDIESTTVLKDAAATAIYGSRGANGVIMLTGGIHCIKLGSDVQSRCHRGQRRSRCVCKPEIVFKLGYQS